MPRFACLLCDARGVLFHSVIVAIRCTYAGCDADAVTDSSGQGQLCAVHRSGEHLHDDREHRRECLAGHVRKSCMVVTGRSALDGGETCAGCGDRPGTLLRLLARTYEPAKVAARATAEPAATRADRLRGLVRRRNGA